MNVDRLDVRCFIAFLVAILITSCANAAVATNSQVNIERRHYVVATDASTVRYSTPFEWPWQSPAIYHPVGSFDVALYYIDNPVAGDDVADWIGFANSAITNAVLPSFLFKLKNVTDFSFYPFACGEPADSPDACTDKIYPMLPFDTVSQGLSGQIANDRISIDYLLRHGVDSYSYHLEATAVPAPGAFYLFVSALGFYRIVRCKLS